jgi:hypothetical protein
VKRAILAGRARNYDVALEDLDGDGRLEVVAALTHTTSTSIERFTPPASLADPWTREVIAADLTSPEPPPGLPPPQRNDSPRLAAADLDGDGRKDLVVTTLDPGEIRVYLQGPGTWTRRDVRTGYPVARVTTGDLDGDGRVDLVTSTYELGTRDRLSWWRNIGE